MYKLLFVAVFALTGGVASVRSQAQAVSDVQAVWKPAKSPLKTRWADQVSPSNVLPEYPRPQLVRPGWTNLNGLWDFAVTGRGSACPAFSGDQILVPFAPESALSGVHKAVLPSQNIWYRRWFTQAALGTGRAVWLHFGAVDFEATVYVNGQLAGTHKGGYTSFDLEIGRLLKAGKNELVVKVYDPTDKSNNAFGKQSLVPHSTWYTATSGIWQTVWLEETPAVAIRKLVLTPDVAGGRLLVVVQAPGATGGYSVRAVASDRGGFRSEARGRIDAEANWEERVAGKTGGSVSLWVPMGKARVWSAEDAYLYDLQVKLYKGAKVVDSVTSYFGMRTIEVKKDASGYDRVFLNGQYTYMLGTLDQGFWPEGGYTAPTDSALMYDILAEKGMGFNTIRKHLKVEPARWYYHCDRLGMLVWQDMPARSPRLDSAKDSRQDRAQFETEMKEMFAQLHNQPSIVMWVLFNEDWAAYDLARLEAWARKEDGSRLINTNTGSKIHPGLSGDLSVVHHYCYPVMPPVVPGKPSILGEFGGVTMVVEDHDWVPGKEWGHGQVMPGQDFLWMYEDMMHRVKAFERQGLSASIFTQPYDVEQEKCGLMTYDRAVYKIDPAAIRAINQTVAPCVWRGGGF